MEARGGLESPASISPVTTEEEVGLAPELS